MKKLLIIQLCMLSLLTSCEEEEPYVSSYFSTVYPQILEDIDIKCIDGTSDYYISATINGEPFCHYEDVVPGTFGAGVGVSFYTSSPEYSSSETPLNVRKNIGVSLGDFYIDRNAYFIFWFPTIQPENSAFDYLDSITQIEYHDIMGQEDVEVPSDVDVATQALIESGSGFNKNFLFYILSTDWESDNRGQSFKISSIFGSQEDSYFRFREVRKEERTDGIYYYMDIEFECNLYHWPQYGYEGLWGEVRDGRIVIDVKIEE